MRVPLLLRTALDWHRPLMTAAALSGLVFAVALAGIAADDRVLVGEPVWSKPARFALSIAVYTVTLAWLLSRTRRFGHRLGTVIAVLVTAELAAIVVQTVRGVRSHFNVATAVDAVVFNAMGVVIMAVWALNLALAAVLLRRPVGDRATTRAVRWGMAVTLAGMPVALLMSPATPEQAAALAEGGSDVIGAHTVGAPDGGPGLPLVGWSTVAGDLRVPHFVGVHGLQAMILVALTVGAVARYRSEAARVRLVGVAGAAYAGMFGLTAWQALRGQSVVAPDAWTLTVAGALLVCAVAGSWWALARRGRRPPGSEPGAAGGRGRPRASVTRCRRRGRAGPHR
ncbi:hypothetical protein AB0I72_25990 [Nocardiopsis sp. NPDC049922]|uniref:hypothetical protein n=1 Tax=Nocardiopsis sp. NPDC049922 TaxID=3155157 RepID=UPI0033F05D78